MTEKLRQLILATKLIDARKKWALIRYIQENDLPEQKLQKFITVFEQEQSGASLEEISKQKRQNFQDQEQELNQAEEQAADEFLAALENITETT